MVSKRKLSRAQLEHDVTVYNADLAKAYLVNAVRTFNRMFYGRVSINMLDVTVMNEEGTLFPVAASFPIRWADMYAKGTSHGNEPKHYVAAKA